MPGKDIEWQRYHIALPDGGPYYAETHPGDYIVEPWNAFSSLFFLIPAFFWANKIKKNLKQNWFLLYCVPLLILGGLGSTFFHAFRSSSLFLLMDIMPILILTFSVSTYFWQKVFNNWIITVLVVVASFYLRKLVYYGNYFPIHTKINISYAITGVSIFLPILLVLIKTGFKKYKTVLVSVALFMLSLFFREIDARSFQLFPMGTHFLWHIFSAAGAFFLADYLFFINSIPPSEIYETKKIKVARNMVEKCIVDGDKKLETAINTIKGKRIYE